MNIKIKFFVCLHGDKIYNSFVCGNTTYVAVINVRGVSTNKTIKY
jgi:hypothetical protein